MFLYRKNQQKQFKGQQVVSTATTSFTSCIFGNLLLFGNDFCIYRSVFKAQRRVEHMLREAKSKLGRDTVRK